MSIQFFSKHMAAHTRRLCAVLFLLTFLFPPFSPAPASSAGLADDHTVLYYLIEMHRRQTRTCNGTPLPEAPSLMPSEALRRLAEESAAAGQLPENALTAAGLAGVPHFATVIPGQAPKQALATLLATQCQRVMGQEYHYIGAALRNGQWTLILSAAEPGQAAAGQPAASPQAPGLAAPGEPSGGMAYALPPAPAAPEAQGAAPQPLVPAQAVPAGSQPAAPFYAPATPGGPAELNNPAPAAPIVVGEMGVSATGEYLPSTWEPLAPTLVPGTVPPPPSLQSQGIQPPAQNLQPALPPPAQASPQPAQPARPGVTPLYDQRPDRPAAGIGVFAEPGAIPPASAAATPLAIAATPGVQTPAPAVSIPPPAVTAPLGNPLPAQTAGTAQVGNAENERLQSARMLQLVNAARAGGQTCSGARLPAASALKNNALLTAAASAHARDMTARRYFSSTTPEARTLGQRITETGYSWAFIAENISARTASPEQALQSWLASPEQCRNIMGQEYLDTGIGFDPAGLHWVITLAAPFDPGPPSRR